MSGIIASLLAYGSADGGGASLLVSATPPSLSQSSTLSSFTMANITAIVSGATGSVTAAWSLIDVLFGSFTIGSPGSLTTNFQANAAPSTSAKATARCTVTDHGSGETAFVDVPLSYRNKSTV